VTKSEWLPLVVFAAGGGSGGANGRGASARIGTLAYVVTECRATRALEYTWWSSIRKNDDPPIRAESVVREVDS